jgi:arylsulfatase
MPHQAPSDWLRRFRGKFDAGWDAIREATGRRQIEMGIVPDRTVNVARPDGIPAWDSLSAEEKRFCARFIEAFAGMLAYQDDQIGRLIDEIDRMGKGENTLIMFIEGDNGAQAAPTLGSLNPIARFANGYIETTADFISALDKIGGPDVLGDYGAGWAYAMSAPFPYFKTFASHLGGTRNGLVVSWPARITARGVRSQFTHVVDVMPTILEATGIPSPTSVNGVKQLALNGVSFADTFARADARERQQDQYFEVSGNRAIYHDGWWANTRPARLTFNPNASTTGIPDLTQYEWQLYDLKTDFSQAHDVAGKYPEKLREMQERFEREAERNKVYPLDDRVGIGRFTAQRLQFPDRKHYTYWGADISVPSFRAPPLFARSFTLSAEVDIPRGGAEGTILAFGGKFGGWSFFVKDGRPGALMAASQLDRDRYLVSAPNPLSPGRATVTFSFARDQGPHAGGVMQIAVDGQKVAEGKVGRTISLLPDPTGALDIGFDGDSPVTDFFTDDARFTGVVHKVDITIN